MTINLRNSRLWLFGALLVCALVYWPGLGGSFVYDDFAFIVTNEAVHVHSLKGSDWLAAATSFPAEHQGRWAGMLSFAANHYVGGLNPWGFKLINLGIHLLNGWLLWLLLNALLRSRYELHPGESTRADGDRQIVAAITLLWLILPINLTGVLYVSQRLESLANTFVLLGLLFYLHARLRDWQLQKAALSLSVSLFACTVLGLTVKESAVLLPLYVGCIELVFFRCRRVDGSVSRAATILMLVALLAPFLIGLLWLMSWLGTDQAYSRSFDTYERLLTQARVLMLYLKWIVVPNLSELTLYHDDIAISRGLFSPWTTFASLLGIALLLLGALLVRRKWPLLALGVLFFFCGHALTSTVIPLMLAFEHRNYFPSIGVMLAMASLLGLEVKALQPRVQWLVLGAFGLFYLGTTQLRVLEWSNPIRLASTEASKRPGSVDAQYDYARTLIRYSDEDPKSPAIDAALARMRASRGMPGSGILFDHAVLILDAKRGEPENLELWESMRRQAEAESPRASDLSAVFTLYQCMQAGSCAARYAELLTVVDAFAKHPQADGRFYALKGTLLASGIGDLAAVRSAYERALALRPKDADIHASYVAALIELDALSEAQRELDNLRRLHGAAPPDVIEALQASIRNKLERGNNGVPH